MDQLFEILKVILLGIVQGITEWLPISSTGHMILVDELIKLNMTQQFKEMFFVVIQLGSILAVVALYFHKLNPFSLTKTKKERIDTIVLWLKVLVAIIPAGVIGILYDDNIDALFYNNYMVVAITLIVYGVLFIVLEQRNKKRRPDINHLEELDFKTALMIGIIQLLALIPGTSRSGSTILGAIFLGTSRFVAAEFSFFMAVPIMFGASLIKLIKFGLVFTGAEIAILLIGSLVAFAVSILAIKFLVGYVKKNDFTAFGYYRIVLGLLVIIYFFLQS